MKSMRLNQKPLKTNVFTMFSRACKMVVGGGLEPPQAFCSPLYSSTSPAAVVESWLVSLS